MATLEERYARLLGLVTDDRKDSFTELMRHLEEDTEWTSSPASTKYHLAQESGLIEHSINVAETAIKLGKMLAPEISISSIVIVSLLHDIGKIGLYIMKEPTEKQKQYGYPGSIAYNTDLTYMEHEVRSLKMISESNLKLTDEEWSAIAYHNQPWNGQSSAFRKNKLMTILQDADYWSTCYLESGGAK